MAAKALKTPQKYDGFKAFALVDTHAVEEDKHAATNAAVTAYAINENTCKNLRKMTIFANACAHDLQFFV